MEASRLERPLSQIAGAGVSRLSGKARGLQADRALSRRSHVLEGDVGAVLRILAQAAQIDRFLEPFIFLKSAGPPVRNAGRALPPIRKSSKIFS